MIAMGILASDCSRIINGRTRNSDHKGSIDGIYGQRSSLMRGTAIAIPLGSVVSMAALIERGVSPGENGIHLGLHLHLHLNWDTLGVNHDS
jgi:hypothetical protein